MTRNASLLTVLLSVLALGGCNNYAKEVKKALERALREGVFKEFTFRGTPTATFGVGTMYLRELESDRDPQTGWLVGHPDTYFASGVSDEEAEELRRELFPKGAFGSFDLTDKFKRGLKLSVALPSIGGILSLTPSVDLEKGVEVNMSATDGVHRQMNWSVFRRLANEGKLRAELSDHIDRRDFLVVAQDIVIEGLTVTIQLDTSADVRLKAALEAAAGVGSIADDASEDSDNGGESDEGETDDASFQVSSEGNGTFKLSAARNVVAAVLMKAPPAAQPLDTVVDVSTWRTVVLEEGRIDALEELVR